MSSLFSPIAYIVFNRPQHTSETFTAIREQRPSTLFIIADGPREGHPEDVDRCRDVRKILDRIDWPCTVHRNYSETNLGCKRRVSTGLDWVFSHVDHAIIVEDDCVASAEFFSFCDTMLKRYEDNEAVWVVAGNSYQPQYQRGDGSYYFSKYADCWGWATWQRAWRHYQGNVPFLEQWKTSPEWHKCFPSRAEQRYWNRVFGLVQRGKVDTWDFPWVACVLYGGGLVATPNANLVRNIGFDAAGTHTTGPDPEYLYELTPLNKMIHPSRIAADAEADEYYFRKFFANQSGLWQRLTRRLKREINLARRRSSVKAA